MSGENKSAKSWGDRVRKASDHQGPWPKVSIWHGSKDSVVAPQNAQESVEQWTNVHGVDEKPTRTETVSGHTRLVFEKDGTPVIEYWQLQGLDHGTPIAAGDGPENCGRSSQWALDAGICSSLHIARFWGIAK